MLSNVAPSFNQSNPLKLYAGSITDQEVVEYEPIVQDAGTGVSLNEWETRQKIRLFVEKNDGVHYAINRGFRRSKGEICAYLTCDEQYLPRAMCAFPPMSGLTSGIFFRRWVFKKLGIFFRTRWRLIWGAVRLGDLGLQGLRMMQAGCTTSVLTEARENICPGPLPERDSGVDFAHA